MIRPVIDPQFAQDISSRYLFASAPLLPAPMTFRQEKEEERDYVNDYKTIQQITQNYQQELVFNLKVNLNFLGNMLQKTLHAASIGQAETAAGKEIRTVLQNTVQQAQKKTLPQNSQTVQSRQKPENRQNSEQTKLTSPQTLQHVESRKFSEPLLKNMQKQAEMPAFPAKTVPEGGKNEKSPEMIPQQRVLLNPQPQQQDPLQPAKAKAKTEVFVRENPPRKEETPDRSALKTAEKNGTSRKNPINLLQQMQTVLLKEEVPDGGKPNEKMPVPQSDPAQILHRKVSQQENPQQPEQRVQQRKTSGDFKEKPQQVPQRSLRQEPKTLLRTIQKSDTERIQRVRQLYEKTFTRFEKARADVRPAQLALKHQPVSPESEQNPAQSSALKPVQKNESRTNYSERFLHRLRLLSDDKIPDQKQLQQKHMEADAPHPAPPLALQHRETAHPEKSAQHPAAEYGTQQEMQKPVQSTVVSARRSAAKEPAVQMQTQTAPVPQPRMNPVQLRYKKLHTDMPLTQQRSILKKRISPAKNITPQMMPLQHMTDRRPAEYPQASAEGTAAVQTGYYAPAVMQPAEKTAAQTFTPAEQTAAARQMPQQMRELQQHSPYAANHAQILYRQPPAVQEKAQQEENAPHDIETIRRVVKEEKAKQEINEQVTVSQPAAGHTAAVQSETSVSVKSVNQIADQVYDILERRLRFEQIRRGGF